MEPNQSICDEAKNYYLENRKEHYGHRSHLAVEALNFVAKKYNFGYGVEGFTWDCGQHGISYINMGDTYDTTILFDSQRQEFSLGCYGDVIEELQQDGIVLD